MYLLWTFLGIIFLGLDLYKKHELNLILACSCLFCAILGYKFPKNYSWQLIGFALFFFSFGLLIKVILKKEKYDIVKNKSLKDYIGKTAIVKKDIGKTLSIDGLGLIEFNNQTWSAKSTLDKEIKAGQKVKIVSKENMIFNVEVLNNDTK